MPHGHYSLTDTAYILPDIHNSPETHKGPKLSPEPNNLHFVPTGKTRAQDCLYLPPPPGLRQHQTLALAGPHLPARHPGFFPTLVTVLLEPPVRELWRPRQPELSSRNHSVVTGKDTGIPKSISILRLKHSADALPSAEKAGPCQICTLHPERPANTGCSLKARKPGSGTLLILTAH